MPQQTLAKKIEHELKAIRKDLNYIIDHITEKEYELTPAEKRDLEEARRELKEGKTTSFEDLKKELRLKHARR